MALPLAGWSVVSAPGCCPPNPFVFGLFTLPSLDPASIPDRAAAFAVHSTLAWIAVALIAVHAAVALLHHFVYKDDSLALAVEPTRRRRAGRPASSRPNGLTKHFFVHRRSPRADGHSRPMQSLPFLAAVRRRWGGADQRRRRQLRDAPALEAGPWPWRIRAGCLPRPPRPRLG